jgi:outer membrane protein
LPVKSVNVAEMNLVLRVLVASFVGVSMGAGADSSALTLAQAVTLARQSDPALLSAQAGVWAADGRALQALGAQRPQLSMSVGAGHNRRRYDTLDSPFPPANDAYGNKNLQLNLTLPLVRPAVDIAVEQSDLAAEQARIQFSAADQDMLVRLAQAWFDWLLARDALVCAEGQGAAMLQQSDQVAYAVQTGLAAAPQAAEARAKYEQALAEQIGAASDLEVKLAALEQVIGAQGPGAPPALADRFAIDLQRSAMERSSLAGWLAQAEQDSPVILAAQRGLQVASEEVRKQQAGEYMTVDLVGSAGSNGQMAGSFPGQNGYNIHQRAIGIQINIPLSTGGSQRGKITESVGLLEKARHELELARRNVRSSTKQAWFGWQAGAARRSASEQSVRFGRLTLKAAEAGERNALKAALEVLQARQQLLGALRDLQKANYEMITSHLKLLASAGKLRDGDLTALDAFHTSNASEVALLREAGQGALTPGPGPGHAVR